MLPRTLALVLTRNKLLTHVTVMYVGLCWGIEDRLEYVVYLLIPPLNPWCSSQCVPRLGGKDNYILKFPEGSELYPKLNSVKTPS